MTASPISTVADRLDGVTTRLPGRYRHLVGVTLFGTFLLMMLGAYTSAIGAGLACPDWPTCYGTWLPFLHPEIIAESQYSAVQIGAEWAHRTVASVVGVGILATAMGGWKFHRDDPVLKWSAVGALALLPLQVLLGGLTVTQSLEPIVVTAHLGLATLILVLLTVTTVTVWWR